MPQLAHAVLAAADDQRQRRVEDHTRNVRGMAFQDVHALLGLVVPDADRFVIRTGDQVGLLAQTGVVDAVHAALVARQGVVGGGAARHTPNFDSPV